MIFSSGVTAALEQFQQFPIPPPHPSFFGKLRKNNLQQFPIPPPHLWQVRKNTSPARIYARGIRLRIAILHAFFPRARRASSLPARRASSSDGVPHAKSSRPGETTPAIHAKPSSRPGDSTPATIHIFDGGGS